MKKELLETYENRSNCFIFSFIIKDTSPRILLKKIDKF
jgi:hypothetical protein